MLLWLHNVHEWVVWHFGNWLAVAVMVLEGRTACSILIREELVHTSSFGALVSVQNALVFGHREARHPSHFHRAKTATFLAKRLLQIYMRSWLCLFGLIGWRGLDGRLFLLHDTPYVVSHGNADFSEKRVGLEWFISRRLHRLARLDLSIDDVSGPAQTGH